MIGVCGGAGSRGMVDRRGASRVMAVAAVQGLTAVAQ